jgi:hypothetical protein
MYLCNRKSGSVRVDFLLCSNCLRRPPFQTRSWQNMVEVRKLKEEGDDNWETIIPFEESKLVNKLVKMAKARAQDASGQRFVPQAVLDSFNSFHWICGGGHFRLMWLLVLFVAALQDAERIFVQAYACCGRVR